MSRPTFRIGDCVQLFDHRGIPLETRHIDRIEYDAQGTLWAGFLIDNDKRGQQCFHVSEHRMEHQAQEAGDE